MVMPGELSDSFWKDDFKESLGPPEEPIHCVPLIFTMGSKEANISSKNYNSKE